MRRVLLLVLGLAAVVPFGVASAASGHEAAKHRSGGSKVLEWNVMTPVTEGFTGPTNPVRGLAGGGLPWEIRRGTGELRSNGRLEVRVTGLVLARRAPVPAALQGRNPVPQFRAIVSCLTPSGTTNVPTRLVPASPRGNASIRTRVRLPAKCVAPIVFVTSPQNAWFAVTGRGR